MDFDQIFSIADNQISISQPEAVIDERNFEIYEKSYQYGIVQKFHKKRALSFLF